MPIDDVTNGPADDKSTSGLQVTPWLLVVLVLASAMLGIDRQLLSILLEPIKHDLRLSDTTLGALNGTAFAVVYTVASFPLARIADTGNRTKLLAICITFWSAATAMCGAAQVGWQLALARMGVAAGEAGNVPASISLLAEGSAEGKRAGRAALLFAGQSLGIAIGMALGGWLGQTVGWRMTFVVFAIPGAIIGLLLLLTTKEPARRRIVGSDKTVSFARALAVLVRLPSYWLLIVGMTFTWIPLYSLSIWSTAFFMRVHQLPLAHAGLSLGLGLAVVTIIGTLLGGRISDWLSQRDVRWYAWFPAFVLLALAFLIPLYANVASSFWALALFLTSSFFATLIAPPIYAIAMLIARPRTEGLLTATLTSCANGAGLGIGPVVIGMINDNFAVRYGQMAIRYSLTFMTIPALLAAIALYALSMTLANDREPDNSENTKRR